ncbi:MBL fold metallo-hydrolase [Zhouia sp. PK063]|uniref:MBL fold metallo-hydrolase n=1 Tax=Zhouia sp. PK063 TaxID=3373602 RepID=UPI003799C4CA
MKIFRHFLLILLLFAENSFAQTFEVLPLGVYGGLNEANISSYLVKSTSSDQYIAMDAGTLYAGLVKAKMLQNISLNPTDFLQHHVQSYFISHPHLDHISGLILNAPSLKNKTIYGLQFTTDAIVKHYFSWDTWANFGDEGEKPQLKNFHIATLQNEQPIQDSISNLKITPFILSHASPHHSTAFLIQNKDTYILYFGDTGPDRIEKSTHLENVWKYVAPLIKKKQLKAVFIETSFPNSQPDKLLFGHLTPSWLNKEFTTLANYTGKKALKNLSIVITHIKPEGDHENTIKNELKAKNPFHLKWIFPKQGVPLYF